MPDIYCNKKICTKCKVEKTLAFFHKNKRTPDGFTVQCAQCCIEFTKQWRHKNPEKARQHARANGARRAALRIPKPPKVRFVKQRTRETEAERILAAVRSRAKAKGVVFNLDIEDIVIPRLCPVFNVPLVLYATKGNTRYCASVDRIIPSLGYTKGNVVVVSWLANRLRNNGTWDQHLQIADFYKPLETERTPIAA